MQAIEFNQLPKVELHLHLDCSLSYEVVQKIDPSIDPETYRQAFIAPPKCTDLADYISRAIRGVDLMQTETHLRWVVLDLFEQLRRDHVIYAEIRFAPLLHTQQGLAPHQVVEIVEDATREGIRETGVEAGIILCTLRHYSEAQSMDTVRLVEAFRGTNIVGFDIAADEAGFPIDHHIKAFEYAREKGLFVTAHAGEARGADSVWETLRHFHPSRIGHGVRSVEDPDLLRFLKERDIHLEVCPTSNVQTNVIPAIEDHPADRIYQTGISMSINTDARTISNVTLAQEYQTMSRLFNWQKAHFLHCNLEAVRHAFLPEAQKQQLRQRLVEAYAIL